MAVNERRRPRSSFEQTLRRIASSIDAQPVREVKWKDRFLPGEQFSMLRVKSLWVAGSFARGASHCGDLDLIADIVAEKGILPMPTTIRRLFIQRAPDVRLYTGNPTSNSSGVAFPDAKMIWSDIQRNYNEAISNIQIDPNATRYERRIDMMPFRMEQLAVEDPKSLEELIDLRDKHIIDWSFIPLETVTVNDQMWSKEALDFADRVKHLCGKKIQKIMPYIIHYLHEETYTEWHFNDNRTSFKFGGNEIYIGLPSVQIELLDKMDCSRLIIAPHISKRGPNGLWLIWRGDKHPLEMQFADVKAYYFKSDGQPSIITNLGGFYSAKSLDIHSNYDRAAEHAAEYEKDTDGEIHYEVTLASGSELLRVISLVDFIDINDQGPHPITFRGQLFCKEEFSEASPLATAEKVIKAISG